MLAPDIQSHLVFQYLSAGLSVIPIERGTKHPSPILPRRSWKRYQETRASVEEASGWLAADPDCNWALAMNKDINCADADDVPLAQWVLGNPYHPVLRGAPVRRSGRGKAHLFFKPVDESTTTVWHLLPGRLAGDVKGAGSYVLVPPSRLPGYQPYANVAGSLRNLPTISNRQQWLDEIVQAFLAANPGESGPRLDKSSKVILVLDDERRTRVEVRVRALGLKAKILDTLFKPGNQDPGTRHWPNMDPDSHSEIDMAVCCELIRKGWQFAEIEEVFAATLVGAACYARETRANHGQGYLYQTYQNAKDEVEKARQAASQAQGANFKVTDVRRTRSLNEAYYHLRVESLRNPAQWGWIVISHEDLLSEPVFTKACLAPPLNLLPEFLASQQGRNYRSFVAAYLAMVSDETVLPEGVAQTSRLMVIIKEALAVRVVARSGQPQSYGEAGVTGWRKDQVYYLRFSKVHDAVLGKSPNTRSKETYDALKLIGSVQAIVWNWPDHEPEQIIRLEVLPPGSGPQPVYEPDT